MARIETCTLANLQLLPIHSSFGYWRVAFYMFFVLLHSTQLYLRGDELRLVCIEDVHRRAIIAPYDVLPVVRYFAGAKVEDNCTGGSCTPGRR